MNGKNRLTTFVPLFALATTLLISTACASNATTTLEATSIQPTVNTVVPPATEPAQPSPPPPTPAPTMRQNYQTGEIITIGDFALVVLGWENIPASDYMKPDQGKKFIMVDLIILNKSQSTAFLTPSIQMYLKDDTGQKHDLDFRVSSLTGSIVVPEYELAPGEKMRDQIGFQISENSQGLQFVFEPSIIESLGKVFVELSAEPSKIDPPAQLPGETQQITHNSGEAVEIDSVTITINEVSYPAGTAFNKPRDGKKFLIVDLTIENKGSNAFRVTTFTQMSLKDSTSQKYYPDFLATSAGGGTPPDGEISPGEKLRGQVGFQVPVNASDLVFIFDPDPMSEGKVFVALP